MHHQTSKSQSERVAQRLGSSTAIPTEKKNKTKSEKVADRLQRLTAERGIERRGLSIPEFCAVYGVSPNSFYRAPESERPVVSDVFGQKRILPAARREWERRRSEKAKQDRAAAD